MKKNNYLKFSPFYRLCGLFLFLILLFSACIDEADFSGFARSTDHVEDRFRNSMDYNAINPFQNLILSTDTYKLLITGDIHVGGPKTNNNYEKFALAASQPEVTAAVYCGDLASGRRADLQLFKDLLPNKPNFVIAGNHDLYFNGWNAFIDLFGTSTYFFTIQSPHYKDLFICLESGGGTFGRSQLAWLKNVLEKDRPNYDQCFVFSHCNFFRPHHTASTSQNMEELMVLLDLFEKHRVDMVITAHDHKRNEKTLGNIKYLILDALRDDVAHASYLVLERQNQGYQYHFKKP